MATGKCEEKGEKGRRGRKTDDSKGDRSLSALGKIILKGIEHSHTKVYSSRLSPAKAVEYPYTHSPSTECQLCQAMKRKSNFEKVI